MKHIGPAISCPLAALDFYRAGFNAIPLVPGTKRTAEKWDPWNERLSELAITEHWREHPDHELGCILGDRLSRARCRWTGVCPGG
jgi:hypothetical protein